MFLCLLSPSVSSVLVSAALNPEETETEKSHRGREGRKENDIENTDPGGRWETKTQKEAVRKDPKKRRNEKE